MNLKNTTRRAERDDPYRLPEQDIAPRRMVARGIREVALGNPKGPTACSEMDPNSTVARVESVGGSLFHHLLLEPEGIIWDTP